jgi:hypothetical protein
MTRQNDPYLEVYWRLADEYPDIWDDDKALSWYVRLLRSAEAAWPTAADVPVGVPAKTWQVLVSADLILPERGGRRYRVRGLDKKRNARSSAASNAARSRWSNATGNAEAMPHNRTEQNTADNPPTPAKRGLRSNGTSPRQVAAQVSAGRKAALDALHLAYQRHEITEDEWKARAAAVRGTPH